MVRVDRFQPGYTLADGNPVVVEDVTAESRFAFPPLLREQGVVSGMTVVIPGPDGPYGVLGTHARTRRKFTEDDADFLRTVATILGEAKLRHHAVVALKESEAKFHRLFQQSPDAVLVVAADGSILEANARAATVFGCGAITPSASAPC
jgi:PAS domain-containing protein